MAHEKGLSIPRPGRQETVENRPLPVSTPQRTQKTLSLPPQLTKAPIPEALSTLPPPTLSMATDDAFMPVPDVDNATRLVELDKPFTEAAKDKLFEVKDGIGQGIVASMFRVMEGYNTTFSWLYANNIVGSSGDNAAALTGVQNDAIAEKFQKDAASAREELDQIIGDPETPGVQRAVMNVTRFMIPYFAYGRFIKGGFAKRNLVVAPLADLSAFTTDEQRLSNMIADADILPELPQKVIEYLAAAPDDIKAESIFKQYVEGALLGAVGEKAISGIGILGAAAGIGIARIFSQARNIKSRARGKATGKIPDTEAIPGEGLTGNIIEEADSKAAFEAQKLLSEKVRMQVGDDPIEIATANFKGRLQEAGIWDAFPKVDQDAKLAWFKNRAEKVYGEGGKLLPPPKDLTGKDALKWEKGWDDNIKRGEAIKEKQTQITIKKTLEVLETKITDRAGPLKRLLRKTPEGKVAIEELALSRGATADASFYNKAAVRAIYQERVPGLPIWKPISKERRASINKMLAIRTWRQIKSRKPEWSAAGNPLTKQNTKFYDSRLEAMRQELGEAEYQEVMKRTDKFFETTQGVLDGMFQDGVVTKESYAALSRWQFSPIRYIQELDQPVAQYISAAGKPVSVFSSGIQPLGKGAEEAIETNSEMFLQEIIIRGVGIRARNRANLAMLEVAETGKIPGIQKSAPKKAARGEWTEISVMKEGERTKMFIAKEYTEMWSASPANVEQGWRDIGFAMGTPLVRLGATGPMNPEFAFTSFPRDMAANILVSDQYSAFIPRALSQRKEDLAEVWDDVLHQKGEFLDYFHEGGGVRTMAQQGVPGEFAAQHTVVDDWVDAMNFANVTSELWNRVATRHRAIKNVQAERGPDYVLTERDKRHATFIARDVIDFDEGGTASKALNEVIPYFNPAILGMRNYARTFKRTPEKAALYAAQLMGIYGVVDIASKSINPEAHSAIPDYINSLYMTVTTPWSFVDDNGDKRFMYFKFPIDHATVGLKVTSDSLNRAWRNEGLPNEKEVDNMRDFNAYLAAQFGVVPGATLPPVIQGAVAYAGNYDWWRQTPAWTGEGGIPPELEFRDDTPEFFRDMGDATGMSPARMEAAIRQVFPMNIYTDIMGATYRGMTSGIEREILDPMEKSLIEKIREFPGARRFIGITSPGGRDADHIREVSEEERGVQVQIERQVDAFASRIAKKVEGVAVEDAFKWIKEEVPFEAQVRVTEGLINSIALEKMFEAINYNQNSIHLPTRTWWKRVANAPPVARARLLVEHISAMQNIDGDKQRKEAKAVIAKAMAVTPGFDPSRSGEFAIALQRELANHNIPATEFLR